MFNRVKKILKTDNIFRKLFIIIPTAILFTGIIMSSYGWYLMNIVGNDSANINVVKAADLQLSYVDGSVLNDQDIYPGWSNNKTFVITNTGNATVTYKIAWRNLTNGLYYRQYLKYSAASTNGGGVFSETQMPDSGNHLLIMDNISISPGVTQSYTITFSYIDSAGNQNADQGKTFAGQLEVLDVHSSTNNPTTTTQSVPNFAAGEIVKNITKEEIMAEYYPIGSIYTSFTDTDPSTLFGGTWERYAKGKTLVSVDTEATEYETAGLTGGSKTHLHETQGHTLTTEELPAHTHTIAAQNVSGGTHYHSMGTRWSGGSGGKNNRHVVSSSRNKIYHNTKANNSHSHTLQAHNTGSNITTESAHDHGDTTTASSMQPYVTVYMWKRTA